MSELLYGEVGGYQRLPYPVQQAGWDAIMLSKRVHVQFLDRRKPIGVVPLDRQPRISQLRSIARYVKPQTIGLGAELN